MGGWRGWNAPNPIIRQSSNLVQRSAKAYRPLTCAAGDSPCASSTTLQCVVVKATPRWCPGVAGSTADSEVTSSFVELTIPQKEKLASTSSLHSRLAAFSLSSRATCVKIDASWLCDCQNKIIGTSSGLSSSILFARLRLLH